MRLSDWPVEPGEVSHREAFVCGHQEDGKPHTSCGGTIMVNTGTFGELAGAIVAHAKAQHGIEIERDGVWYRSFAPDGKLWAESSSVDDFTAADLDGMEGEELEHWTAHNAKMAELRYGRVQVYTVAFAEEWKPEMPAQTEDERLGLVYRAGTTEEQKENSRDLARLMRGEIVIEDPRLEIGVVLDGDA